MTRLYCDGPTLLRAVASAVANLERHVDEVDALNVFPVPDGDTGSNMLATMHASLAEAEKLPDDGRSLKAVADALSRGALTGARGNSGVILSQIIRGMTDGTLGRRRASGLDLAQGLRRGSEVAYGSVLMPVEGTILTVIRDAAEAAESAAGKQPHVESVLVDTIEAAARSVQRTPTLLPVLEDAGVVDSGGQGLYRLLEGTMQLGEGGTPKPAMVASVAATRTAVDRGADQEPPGLVATDELPHHGGHGYEVEFVVSAEDRPLEIDVIQEQFDAIGDSVVVAGDAQLARVHVHGPRPDLAIGIGMQWGRLSSARITDLDAQIAALAPASAPGPASASTDPAPAPTKPPASALAQRAVPAGTALLAVANAAGLAATLEGFGAHIVWPAHGARPSVGEIAEAVLAAGNAEVIILPNDRDAHLAAAQADSLTPLVAVSVIPTRNVAEGIAAALVFDGNADLATNTQRMEAEASDARTFSVATAARDSIVDGVEVRLGQVLALDGGHGLLACEDDLEAATLRALASLGAYELVTLYRGVSLDEANAQRLADRIAAHDPPADVEMIAGDMPHHLLLVAVE